MRRYLGNIIASFIGSLFTIPVAIYYDSIVSVLEEQNVSLENQIVDLTNQVKTFQNSQMASFDELKGLVKEVDDSEIIEEIELYRSNILAYVSEMRGERKMPEPDEKVEEYSYNIPREELVEAVNSFCSKVDFFLIFSYNRYIIPVPVLQAMGDFYYVTTKDCSVLEMNTDRIKNKRFLKNIAFDWTGLEKKGYGSFESQYNKILYEAKKLIDIMDQKIRHLS